MNQDDQAQGKAAALLQSHGPHQQWLREARRWHTKNLFGLWLLLVLGICVLLFALPLQEQGVLQGSVLGAAAFLIVLLVIFTGAYVFQEVARVHKRIDAILNLLEEEWKK